MSEILCINIVVKYTYKLKNFLYNKELGPMGFCVLVMTNNYFYEVDVPADIFDPEIMAYIKFRLSISHNMEISRLPPDVQDGLKEPLGFFIECWLLENEDGDSGGPEDFNA
jgi:hypothetical protein